MARLDWIIYVVAVVIAIGLVALAAFTFATTASGSFDYKTAAVVGGIAATIYVIGRIARDYMAEEE